ncbi:uncharacterized protein NPIL_332991 [Nephila pilipes]|uniref:Uncharacterized protein n=1 Tax=Nephila pilipes TaxID=299642 RepID=A0A8X6U0R3_NEPPI|nr:uncharacterized protein NPIL_332991 [Nephila pilipes]
MIFYGIFISFVSLILVAEATYHIINISPQECNCLCKEKFQSITSNDELTVCQVLKLFDKEILTMKKEIERRNVFRLEIDRLNSIMEEHQEIIKKLEEQAEKESLPTPASLIMQPLNNKSIDSNMETHIKEEKELANNVSNLLAKVEVVENLTNMVQEELQSERRVRRHLEENLEETRTTIKLLDDKLQNVTFPMDNRVSQVEEVVFSTLENMNKTLFDDHLKKLYYKVNGVVYKNETEKLDKRLDQVETELMDVSNTSTILKFAEELKNLTMTVNSLNETFTEKLIEEEYRMDTLENKTDKIREIGSLEHRVHALSNTHDLIRNGLLDLRRDVENIQNGTIQIANELFSQSTKNSEAVEDLKFEVSVKLDSLTGDISSLRNESISIKDSLDAVKQDVIILQADVATSENKVQELTLTSQKKIDDVYWKIDNITYIWDSSLSTVTEQIAEWKKSKDRETVSKVSSIISQTPDDEYKDESSEVVEISTDDYDELTRMRSKGEDKKTDSSHAISTQGGCKIPSINDSHILMSSKLNDHGDQILVFGCKPIGKYGLQEIPVPMHCINGEWIGGIPKCVRLLQEDEVIATSQEVFGMHPCRTLTGDIPDPYDCNFFFKCDHGMVLQRINCPNNLHFSSWTYTCDFPYLSKCKTSLSGGVEILRDLIPTIQIDPNNVDRPFGLMGTGGTGELIVYPRTSFQVHCLFPHNAWGEPTWDVEYLATGISTTLPSENSRYRASFSVIAATQNSSGIYTCKSPFGKINSLTIIIKDVSCPKVDVDPEAHESTVYRKHPDGEYRVLSTTVEYLCENNFSITAMCLPNGTWSRPPPTAAECKPRITNSASTWGCPVINIDRQSGLILGYDRARYRVTFKCPENKRLVGPSYTTCYNGSWSHSSLPSCNPLGF